MSEAPIVTDKAAPQNAIKDMPVKVEPDFPIEIDDFCLALSTNDKRVELISGFHKFMEQAGKTRLTQSEFTAEFGKFITMPV